MNPSIRILAGFSKPDGNIVTVAEIKIGLDDLFGRRGPVFVEGIHQIGVKGSAKDGEVGVPLRTTQDDEMVSIRGADGSRESFVERLQLVVVFLQCRKMRDRFVE